MQYQDCGKESKAGRTRIKRPQRDRMLRMDWLERAAQLPGRSLHYAVALHAVACLRQNPTVSAGKTTLSRFGVTPDAAGDALTRLEGAGLVRAVRGRGRVPEVTLLELTGGKLVIDAGEAR